MPSGEGDNPTEPDFIRELGGDWEYVPGQNYPARALPANSVFSVVSGDGGGYGDPLLRDPDLVLRDLATGVTTRRTAISVNGVVIVDGADGTLSVDVAATEQTRNDIRKQRLSRAIPAAQYKAQARERLVSGDIPLPAKAMYRDVLKISEKWRNEFIGFWALPDDYEVPA